MAQNSSNKPSQINFVITVVEMSCNCYLKEAEVKINLFVCLFFFQYESITKIIKNVKGTYH